MSTKLDRTSQMLQIDVGDPAPKGGKPAMLHNNAVYGKDFSGLTGANDSAAPKVPTPPRITIDDSKLAAGEPATVTITFDEPVKSVEGFAGGPDGTFSELSSADGGRTWTGTLTGANNTAAPMPPMPFRITIDDSKLAAGKPATVTITFDEPVKNVAGFPEGLLNSPDGTLSDLSSADGGRTWTGTLTGASDSAAPKAPTPTSISIDDSQLAAGGPATVTITFDEPVESVKGFAKDLLSSPNGELSDLSSADGGWTWTGTLNLVANTPDAGNAEATLPDTAYKADKEQGDSMVLDDATDAPVDPAAKAKEAKTQALTDDQSSTESKSEAAQDTDDNSVAEDDNSVAEDDDSVAEDDNWNGAKAYAKVDDRDGNYYSDDYSNGGYNWDYNWDDASGAADVQPLLIVGRPSDADSYWF
ncbi:hypothetical protein D5039_04645 [Verminephrobacter aporrectodeae subsp. tuberculatae]|uniref:Bacterial Ig-like domain-containing protein n=1 Tax=Verminephrobacter aporrectodeae subsp. tuberculatae TaxID=1110392 RepID=A0ABT3KQA7_9BURK|nr:Ig-like domain-containing protein [Verminephrobacter aporrectodeae]MCW5320493.1 hypothetical protein [Verminephrobacter aporrectodeae subsp. tuberculatae]